MNSSPHSHLVLLVCFAGADNILRFPSESREFPGLHLTVAPETPLEEQVRKHIEARCSIQLSPNGWNLDPQFAEELDCKGSPVLLRLVTLPSYAGTLPSGLCTFPQLLKSMNKDRSRLPYLKAWQYLAGAHLGELQAVEI